jgi:hypothetical protein
MMLRQICAIELSLTYFRLADVCVDIARQYVQLRSPPAGGYAIAQAVQQINQTELSAKSFNLKNC